MITVIDTLESLVLSIFNPILWDIDVDSIRVEVIESDWVSYYEDVPACIITFRASELIPNRYEPNHTFQLYVGTGLDKFEVAQLTDEIISPEDITEKDVLDFPGITLYDNSIKVEIYDTIYDLATGEWSEFTDSWIYSKHVDVNPLSIENLDRRDIGDEFYNNVTKWLHTINHPLVG